MDQRPNPSSEAEKDQLSEDSAEDKRELLEPIRVVERELTRPDGTKLRVDVPVYAPFELEKRHAKPAPLRRALRMRRSGPAKAEEESA